MDILRVKHQGCTKNKRPRTNNQQVFFLIIQVSSGESLIVENMKKTQDYLIQYLTNHIVKNPVKNTKRIINLANSLGFFKEHKPAMQAIFEKLEVPGDPWHGFIQNFNSELNLNTRKKVIANFLLKGGLFTRGLREKRRAQGLSSPFTVLMDPTTICNLNCLGCWANDYEKTDSLSYETLSRIITEGKELGIYVYIYSGGEPLVRKKDIIKLCEEHDDCFFLAFTNGTLINEQFAKDVARVGNFAPAVSIEGFEKDTDFRRGDGTYKKAIRGMKLMKKYGNLFGYSTAYHRLNTEVVGSDEFVNSMHDLGARFGWYFTYMPVGSDAKPELIVTPEQRAYMYRRIREIRSTSSMFLMDFWNDGEFVGGCIAGGRNYLHINAAGAVEPCAFIHYSNVNIKDVSLAEALEQPIFKEYQKRQPFNHNDLRPCPCLDNPSELRDIVHCSSAVSTQPNDSESVEDLTAKCENHAAGWAIMADDLLNKKNGKNGKPRSKPVIHFKEVEETKV